MTIIKCDLCSQTLNPAELITLRIEQNMRSPISYDLCGQCAKTVRENINNIINQRINKRNGEKENGKQ